MPICCCSKYKHIVQPVTNIIQNGIDAGLTLLPEADIKLLTMVQTHSDEDPDNNHTLPGKIIRGKRPGALMQITEFENASGSTTFLVILFPKTLK